MFKKTAIVSGLIIALFILCLAAVWIRSEARYSRAIRPPAGATNIVLFLKSRPDSTRPLLFTNEGRVYLEISRPISNPGLALPSGPPAYIFDSSGDLVDWTPDLGDDPKFHSKWSGLTNATAITFGEAKELINK
jgi:hypothetical protein